MGDFASPTLTSDDLRLLADNLPTLAWMADAQGYLFWYNRRWHVARQMGWPVISAVATHWHEYCGTTPEQMEGWGWQSVHDPAVLPDVLARWRASIASGSPFEMIFPLRGADGVFRPFLTRAQPVRDQAGQVTRWFGTNTEISSQVAAEQRLRESEAQLRELVDTLDLATVLVRDLDGTIRFWSRGCERLYGWTAEEAVGREARDLLRTEYPLPLAAVEAILLRDGEWRGDLRQAHRDGTRLVVAAYK